MNKESPQTTEARSKTPLSYIDSQIWEVLKDHKNFLPNNTTLEQFIEEIKIELRNKNRTFIQEIIDSQEACDLNYSKLLAFIIQYLKERKEIEKKGGKQMNLDFIGNQNNQSDLGEIDIAAGDLWK